MASGDLAWMDEAACRQRPDLDWFDLDCNLEPCLGICAVCPVADDCLAYAVTHELRDGLWGGEWGYRLAEHVRKNRGGRGHRGR